MMPLPSPRHATLARVLLAMAAIVPGALAQTSSPTTMTAATKDKPAATDAGAEVLAKAVADLGESPIAAILDAAGPDVRRYNDHINTLANPFFEGRAPGLRGNRLAAEYIEYWFRQAKLRPAFPTTEKAADGTTVVTNNTSYRQPFQRGTDLKVERQEVTLDLVPGGAITLRPDEDFTVLGTSGSGEVTAPIALVGYGIAEGKDGYTSFPDGTDLSGKIALVFRFEPINGEGKSRWAEDGWSPAASLDAKLQAIADHHAAGIILVNPPGAADARAKQLSTTAETRAFGKPLTIPVVMVRTELAEKLVKGSKGGRSLLDYRKQADQKGGITLLPDAKATIATGLSVEPIMTDNVGGILPGKGKLADQYIIIGAHYDHVGYGPVGTEPKNNGKLHPGADDNGSGSSGVLLLSEKLAKAYAELPEGADARSILFMTFSAEESGLIGSHYYVNHPTLSASQMDLMLNLDMIGRLKDGKLEVQGTESAAGFYDWLEPFFKSSGLTIAHGSEVAGNSDHASFYQKKMPVLFFFTGLHKDYHQPTDFAYKINQIGAVQVVNLVYNIALAAAQRTEPLVYTPRHEKPTDPHASADPAQPLPKGVGRVRFGIAPASYSDDKPGVEVGDVYEGTSAADAGIKQGDRLMKWNGKSIENVEAWMPLLTQQKPGDVVEVTILRDGKELTLNVKLKARAESDR